MTGRFPARRRPQAVRRRVTRRAVGLAIEPFEPRTMLAADPLAAAAFGSRVAPDWFAEAPQAGGGDSWQVVAASAGSPIMAEGASSTASAGHKGAGQSSAATEWIVQLSDAGLASMRSVSDAAEHLRSAALGLEVVRGLGLPGQLLVRAAASADAVRNYLGQASFVMNVSPNSLVTTAREPNDPSYGSLYGLNNLGQTGGVVDADIDAPEAWARSIGSRSIVVGVIDSGIDWSHEDLAANMWRNPGEISGNGIDDDANGFVDDVYGYDFVNNDGDPMDDHSHGTHCAGTIGAVGDNGTGVVGVNWQVSLMGLKFLNAQGQGSTADAIRAVNYATMMRVNYGVNVRVTSNSWGGAEYDQGLLDAINAGGNAGILFVAAAGNDGANTDSNPAFPAAYESPFIVSVAATDSADGLASFSNYGAATVDLGAPGVDIVSTTPGNNYQSYSGTSMATPHVAGAAALALAVDPTLTPLGLKAKLLATATPVPALAGKTVSGGRLNADNLLASLGLSVTTTTPALGSVVSAAPTEYVVSFNDPFVPASVGAEDFSVNGRAATAFTILDEKTIRFTFDSNPVVSQGLQTMTMAAGALTRASDSSPSLAFDGSFRLDEAPLTPVATTPASGSVITRSGPFTLDISFSEPLAPVSVQASDLLLSGLPGLFVSSATLLPGNTTVRFVVDLGDVEKSMFSDLFPAAIEGALAVQLPAGAVTDEYGNPGSSFAGTFELETGLAPLGSFDSVAPAGAGVFKKSVLSQIGIPGDTDAFTLTLAANQTLTIDVLPLSEAGLPVGVRPRLRVLDSTGATVAEANAGAGFGPRAVVQNFPVTVEGTYRIEVAGAGGTTGLYWLQVFVNTAVEQELLSPTRNDTAATAQSLDGAFRSVSTSLATGRIAAVRGVGDNAFTETPVPYVFQDISGSGTVIAGLTNQDDAAVGIDIGFAFPLGGVPQTRVFVSSNGLLTFDTPNAESRNSSLFLPTQAMIAPFWDDLHTAGGVAGSNVFSRVSGRGADRCLTIQWNKVRFTEGGASGDTITFQAQLYADGRTRFNYEDLVSGSAPGNDGGSATVGVRTAGTDAEPLMLSWDEPDTYAVSGKSVMITWNANPADFYKFSAAAGDVVVVALGEAIHFPGFSSFSKVPNVDLLDVAGNVLARGVPAQANDGCAIASFPVKATGTYFVRISGSSDPYSLAVTRNGMLETETNDSPATAQRIGGRTVFGSFSADQPREDWYSLTLAAGQTRLGIETATPTDRPGAGSNVDPRIALYDSTGTNLVMSGVPLADGRNERIEASGLVPGRTYLIRVASEAAPGDYVLGLTAGVVPPPPAMFVRIVGVSDDVGSIQGQVTNGGVTNDNTPTLSGTLSAALGAGERVRIFRNGTPIGTATVSGGTNWTFTSPVISADGPHAFTAAVVNRAGMVRTLSAGRSIELDTAAPTQTVRITSVSDDAGPQQGVVVNGGRTDDITPTLSGTVSAPLAAGETLKIYSGVTFLADAVVDPATLAWTATPVLNRDGAYPVTARVVDTAGNRGGSSGAWAFTLDRTAPAQVARISGVSDNVGSIRGQIADGGATDDTTPTLTGTLSAALGGSETVRIFRNGTAIGSATVSGGTNWTFTSPAIRANGLHAFTAAVVDGAGNVGPLSASWSIVLDTATPTRTPVSPRLSTSDAAPISSLAWAAFGTTEEASAGRRQSLAKRPA